MKFIKEEKSRRRVLGLVESIKMTKKWLRKKTNNKWGTWEEGQEPEEVLSDINEKDD